MGSYFKPSVDKTKELLLYTLITTAREFEVILQRREKLEIVPTSELSHVYTITELMYASMVERIRELDPHQEIYTFTPLIVTQESV